jgi:hypothetical protein
MLWVCVCIVTYFLRRIILSFVACLVVPYCFHIIAYWHEFQEKIIENELCVLIFSTTFVWNISYLNKNSARYEHIFTYIFMSSTRYFCQILMKPEFSWQILKKCSNITFHENPSRGSRRFPCWQTDRRRYMTKLTDDFRKFSSAHKEGWGDC